MIDVEDIKVVMDELANSGIYYSGPAVAKPQRALRVGREAIDQGGIVQLPPFTHMYTDTHRHTDAQTQADTC